MAIATLKGLTPEWWTPEDEREQDEPASFHIAPLSGPQMLEVQEHFDLPNQTIKGPGLLMACRIGLRGWKNIVDDEGKALTFTRSAIDRLPADTIAIIGAQVIANSVVDEDTEKN